MLKPDDRIIIEINARDALKAMIVLGRCNGSPCEIYGTLCSAIDPERKFRDRDSNLLTYINYKSIQDKVESEFFSIKNNTVLESVLQKIKELNVIADQLRKGEF